MIETSRRWLPLLLVLAFSAPLQAQEEIPWEVVQKIRVEATKHSQAVEMASYLTDVFGPRLANSPSYHAAAEWARARLEEMGLQNAVLDPYGEFGVSWSNELTSVHMIAPQYMQIIAYPNTWCRGIEGRVRGRAVYLDFEKITSETDLAPFQGRLENAIVFIEPVQKLSLDFDPKARRLDEEELAELELTPLVVENDADDADEPRHRLPAEQIIAFLEAEGAAAIASPDGREDYGTVMVNEVPGRAWVSPEALYFPYLILAAEHYNRVLRILDKGIAVELEVEMRIAVDDGQRMDYNVIADLPGADLADEVVILGAHLDANSPGQGATDNAAGVVAVMEAIRILKAIDARPRRTIRVALWGGEEYGLLGSRGYVAEHYGNAETQEHKEAHGRMAAYFNKDGGGGKIRGVYLQGNEQLRPIFQEWIEPLRDLGVDVISNRSSLNSDHASFDAVGLPGINFVQDPLERRAYHTNMDTFDRLVAEDLVQTAIVIATLGYQAAISEVSLPRFVGHLRGPDNGPGGVHGNKKEVQQRVQDRSGAADHRGRMFGGAGGAGS